MHPQEVHEVFS